MYGLEAISYYKGWAMAIIGITIVISCLIFLSFVISQLHKLLEFLDRKKESSSDDTAGASGSPSQSRQKIVLPSRFPDDISEAARLYEPLIEEIGGSFQLVDLYKAAREHEYPHPHLTISAFRQAGILSVAGEGVFNWNYSS